MSESEPRKLAEGSRPGPREDQRSGRAVRWAVRAVRAIGLALAGLVATPVLLLLAATLTGPEDDHTA